MKDLLLSQSITDALLAFIMWVMMAMLMLLLCGVPGGLRELASDGQPYTWKARISDWLPVPAIVVIGFLSWITLTHAEAGWLCLWPALGAFALSVQAAVRYGSQHRRGREYQERQQEENDVKGAGGRRPPQC